MRSISSNMLYYAAILIYVMYKTCNMYIYPKVMSRVPISGSIPLTIVPSWDVFLSFSDRSKWIKGKLSLTTIFTEEAQTFAARLSWLGMATKRCDLL